MNVDPVNTGQSFLENFSLIIPVMVLFPYIVTSKNAKDWDLFLRENSSFCYTAYVPFSNFSWSFKKRNNRHFYEKSEFWSQKIYKLGRKKWA